MISGRGKVYHRVEKQTGGPVKTWHPSCIYVGNLAWDNPDDVGNLAQDNPDGHV